MASAMELIVLAVNMPPHAPSPGHALRSISSSSSFDRLGRPGRLGPGGRYRPGVLDALLALPSAKVRMRSPAKTVVVPSGQYFGKYYQDIQRRVPSIAQARKQLGWKPKVDLPTAIRRTLDFHLAHRDYKLE